MIRAAAISNAPPRVSTVPGELQRVAGDSPRVRAVRDRELNAAGGAVEELPGITGDGAAEVANPVGEAAGSRTGMVGDFGKLVAQ